MVVFVGISRRGEKPGSAAAMESPASTVPLRRSGPTRTVAEKREASPALAPSGARYPGVAPDRRTAPSICGSLPRSHKSENAPGAASCADETPAAYEQASDGESSVSRAATCVSAPPGKGHRETNHSSGAGGG